MNMRVDGTSDNDKRARLESPTSVFCEVVDDLWSCFDLDPAWNCIVSPTKAIAGELDLPQDAVVVSEALGTPTKSIAGDCPSTSNEEEAADITWNSLSSADVLLSEEDGNAEKQLHELKSSIALPQDAAAVLEAVDESTPYVLKRAASFDERDSTPKSCGGRVRLEAESKAAATKPLEVESEMKVAQAATKSADLQQLERETKHMEQMKFNELGTNILEEINELGIKNLEKDQKVSSLEQKMQQLLVDLDDARSEAARSMAMVAGLQNNLTTLKNERVERENEAKAKMQQMEADLGERQSEASRLQTDLEACKELELNQKECIKELQADLEASKELELKQKECIKEFEEDGETHRAENAGLKARIESLYNEQSQLIGQIQVLELERSME